MKLYKDFFGKQLQGAIDLKGWTQAFFAEKMDVENSTVSNWVAGNSFPKGDKFPKICEVLGVTQTYFLPFSVSTKESVKAQKEFQFASQLAKAIDPNGLDFDDFLFVVQNLKNIPGDVLLGLCKINDPIVYNLVKGIVEPLLEAEAEESQPQAKKTSSQS